MPAGGTNNWTNGFLPAQHQGVTFNTSGQAIRDLAPARPIAADVESASRALHRRLNALHQEQVGGKQRAGARMRAYELAAKMQLRRAACHRPIGRERGHSQALRPRSGITAPFGRNCLLARRLIENGVRFVQLFSGGAFGSPRINWDGHEDVKANHTQKPPSSICRSRA